MGAPMLVAGVMSGTSVTDPAIPFPRVIFFYFLIYKCIIWCLQSSLHLTFTLLSVILYYIFPSLCTTAAVDPCSPQNKPPRRPTQLMSSSHHYQAVLMTPLATPLSATWFVPPTLLTSFSSLGTCERLVGVVDEI